MISKGEEQSNELNKGEKIFFQIILENIKTVFNWRTNPTEGSGIRGNRGILLTVSRKLQVAAYESDGIANGVIEEGNNYLPASVFKKEMSNKSVRSD